MTVEEYEQWDDWLNQARKSIENWKDEHKEPPLYEDVDNARGIMTAVLRVNPMLIPRRRFMWAGGISYSWNANKRRVTIEFQDGDVVLTSSKPKGDGMRNIKANCVDLDSVPPMELATEIRDFLNDTRYAYPLLNQ